MTMRAKMKITKIDKHETYEVLQFTAVSRSNGYPEDGSDENNSYAKFTPSGSLSLTIANPALIGQFKLDKTYYLDFSKAE